MPAGKCRTIKRLPRCDKMLELEIITYLVLAVPLHTGVLCFFWSNKGQVFVTCYGIHYSVNQVVNRTDAQIRKIPIKISTFFDLNCDV